MSSGSTLPVSRDLPPSGRERRKTVRRTVKTPAFAGMNANSTGINLDLHQIVDLSEEGMAFQSAGPLEVGETVEFSVDLSAPKIYFHSSGRVAWSSPSGRTGVRFQKTSPEDAGKLREWLFANGGPEVAAEEYGEVDDEPILIDLAVQAQQKAALENSLPRPQRSNFSGLFAIEGLKLEIEAVAFDLDSALQLVVQRALSLTLATGAAIALSDGDGLVCRATSGPDAPPVGARLQSGSGFSGECVRTAQLLHCDDSELDSRVDRESCRALNIRSIVAAPISKAEGVMGLIEIFSPEPGAFGQADKVVLQGMAEIVLEAVERATQVVGGSTPALPVEAPRQPEPTKFSDASRRETDELIKALAEVRDAPAKAERRSRWRIPWIFVIVIAAAVLLAVWLIVFGLSASTAGAPRKISLEERSSEAARQASLASNSLDDLQKLASRGDTLAGFTLGLRYATGADAPQDYSEAVRWFSFAAERGHVMAQSTLGAYYWAGRGVPQDLRKAYFWALLAQSAGDDASRARLPFLVSRLERGDIVAVQREADNWMKEHQSPGKPSPGGN